jgi:hypothetical protein
MTEDTAAGPPAPLWGRMLCTWLSAQQNSEDAAAAPPLPGSHHHARPC